MTTPVPRDIPLPLPASAHFLEVLLIVSFLAHILFVNLVVGSAMYVLVYEIRGRRDAVYDALAKTIAETITVNKSLAVVLGVAPLLTISVLYTVHFYTANALTGTAWIMVIPMATAAFGLLYLHKYTWEAMSKAKGAHTAIIALAVVLLLLIPFVFIANANLMMFPDAWGRIRGFASALAMPSVLPRYVHFVLASGTVTSLAFVYLFGIRSTGFEGLPREELRRQFYSVAFALTIAQFVAGPLVLFTVPSVGLGAHMLLAIGTGVAVAIPAVVLMWRELVSPSERPWGRYFAVTMLLSVTVVLMVTGRQMYRAVALRAHRSDIADATQAFLREGRNASEARQAEQANVGADPMQRGASLFASNCGGCHTVDLQLVGPSLREVASIYGDDVAAVMRWVRAPGRKRPGAPQMPAFNLPAADLRALATYVLSVGRVGPAAIDTTDTGAGDEDAGAPDASGALSP